MNRLIAFFARQRIFGNLLTFFVIVAGYYSMTSIQREVFPNVKFDVINIQTIFQGATPEEMERLVTNVIEQEIKEVDGIKTVRSTSAEGLSDIKIQLNPDETTADKGKDDIQNVIDRLTDLPAGSEKPVVISMETKYQPVVELYLYPKGEVLSNPLVLREQARLLEREIKQLKDVAKVQYSGWQDLEFRIEPNLKSLAREHITLEQLITTLQNQNKSTPAGKLEGQANEQLIRTLGEYANQDEIENTVIRANDYGEVLRLKDVASVHFDQARPKVLTQYQGKRAIRMLILQKEKADTIRLMEELRAKLIELKPTLLKDMDASEVNDASSYISRRLNVLNTNLLVGLTLVLLLLSLILPFKVALLVSVGIPFGFLGTMICFLNAGVSLNLISLVGLIIVTGMLVDDAVVVTDNCVRLIDEGLNPEEAAIKGTQQIWPSVCASVLTTIVAFMPLMFMSGIFGKFVKQISYGVILALLISLVEAFVILPGHIAAYIKKRKTVDSSKTSVGSRFLSITTWTGQAWNEKLLPRYVALMKRLIVARYRTLMIFGLVFVGILFFSKTFMKVVLFPPNGVEIFTIKVKADLGSSLDRTEALLRPINARINEMSPKELLSATTLVGENAYDPMEPGFRRGTEYAYILVFLTPSDSRKRSADTIMEEMRTKVGRPPGFEELQFSRVSSGPPVGKPVSLSVTGKDFSKIRAASEDLKRYLATVKGVKDISDTYALGKEEIRLRIKQKEAVAAGLDATSIGLAVRAAFEGIVATSLRNLAEEVDLRVLLESKARASLQTLSELRVLNRSGQLIPLRNVVEFDKGQGLQVVDHKDYLREVNVAADIDYGVTSSTEANDSVRTYFAEFSKRHPGIGVSFGGEDQDTVEAFQSLGRAFVVAFMAIFLILVMTFQNMSQPLLVMVTIPFGIMAALIAFFLHGWPITFMGGMGIIALGGVIVNNAIVMIDFVNQNRKRGMDSIASILEAASARIRPIFLTTGTTVVGLLPTAYGIGGLDEFVVPIALALGWGLLFGSLMTALIFPVAIAVLDDFVVWLAKRRAKYLNRQSSLA